MTSRRRALSFFGASGTAVGAGATWLAACGQGAASAPKLDTSRQVTLRMAARTDQQANGFWSGVAAEVNQRFKNVQIELEQYPGSEYVTNIVTLTAGGTQATRV